MKNKGNTQKDYQEICARNPVVLQPKLDQLWADARDNALDIGKLWTGLRKVCKLNESIVVDPDDLQRITWCVYLVAAESAHRCARTGE